MLTNKFVYIFLLILNIVAKVTGFLTPVLAATIFFVAFMNRSFFYIVKGNMKIREDKADEGYALLNQAYNSGYIPFNILHSFIFLSIKFNKLKVAEEAIKRALDGGVYALDSNKTNEILVQQAVLLWQQNKLVGAVDIMDRLYKEGYKTRIFYGNYAYLLFINGDIAKAEEIGLEALAFAADDLATLDNLTMISLYKKDYDKAEEYFSQLESLNPTFAEAWYHGAQLEIYKGNKNRALEYWTKASSFELPLVSSINQKDLDNIKDKISVMS